MESVNKPKETRGVTRKELVADFLTGKSFLNSRIAFRQFKSENPSIGIKQTYFYTLFKSFGIRSSRRTKAFEVIQSGEHKNAMTAYKEYLKGDFASEKAIRFTCFLKLWKIHHRIDGYVRRKEKTEKVAKVKVVAPEVKISTMSAKEIIGKANELLKEKANVLPTNLKNKAGIVKKATQLFKDAGYKVA